MSAAPPLALLEAPPWPDGLLGAGLFFATWGVASLVAVLLFERVLGARARATPGRWDDVLAHAVRLPLLAGLLAAGVFGLTAWFPSVPDGWGEPLRVAAWVALALAVAHGMVVLAAGLVERRSARDGQVAAMRWSIVFGVRLVVWSVALLVVLHHLGVTITPLLGAFGIGGLAVALALQDTLSNFFAGLSLRLDRPLQEGDYVELDGGWVRGRVHEVSWRSVRIRDAGGNTFHLPNSRAATTPVRTSRRAVTVPFHVQYDADLREVEAVVARVGDEVLARVGGGAGRAFVRYAGFANEGVALMAVLPVRRDADQFLLAHEFVRDVHERLGAAGISIRWLPGHVPRPSRWSPPMGEDVRPRPPP